jgi:hypothetical protein
MKPLATHLVPLEETANLMDGVAKGTDRDYIKGVVALEQE